MVFQIEKKRLGFSVSGVSILHLFNEEGCRETKHLKSVQPFPQVKCENQTVLLFLQNLPHVFPYLSILRPKSPHKCLLLPSEVRTVDKN